MENDLLSLHRCKLISANIEVYQWVKTSRIKWTENALQRKNKATKKYRDDMIKISMDYNNFEAELIEYFRNVRECSRKLQSAIIKNFHSLDTLILYSDEIYELKRSLKGLYAKHHFIYYQIQRLTDKIVKKKKGRTELPEIEEEFKLGQRTPPPGQTTDDQEQEQDEEPNDDEADEGEGDGEDDEADELEPGSEQIAVTVLDDVNVEPAVTVDPVYTLEADVAAASQPNPKTDQEDDDEDSKPKKKKKKKKAGKKGLVLLKAYNSLFGQSNLNIGMKPVSLLLTNAGLTLGTINTNKFIPLNDFMLGLEMVKISLQCDIRYLEMLSNDLQEVYRNRHTYEHVKKTNLEDLIFRCSSEIIENIFKLELECTKFLMEY